MKVSANLLHLSLVQGRKYQMRYKYQAGNYRWVERYAVVVYIDRIANNSGLGQRGELFFSGRPVFGDFTIAPQNILELKPVSAFAKCYSDRKEPRT